MKTAKEIAPKKRGRKQTIPWNKVTLLWKSHTTAEIAQKLNCTIPAVHMKRKSLIAAAEKAGKDASFYECKKPAYSRSRFLVDKAAA